MHRKTPADRAPPQKYPIPAYTNAYSGPENAGNPKGSTEFFSKIGKYLGFKSDLETASYCCIIPRRPLKMLFYTLLEKLCTEKKKPKKVQNEVQSVESNKLKQLKKKSAGNCRSNLKLKWNQHKKSHWYWWTLAFHKALHHVSDGTKYVCPYTP